MGMATAQGFAFWVVFARKAWWDRSVVGTERTKGTIVRETLHAETGKTPNSGEQEPAAVIAPKD